MNGHEKTLVVDKLGNNSLSGLEAALIDRRNQDLSGLSATQQAELLAGRCQTILPFVQLEKRLAQAKSTGKPLEIKFGIDPTGADVHLGHAVPIIILQRLQRMGHNVTLVIGDSTASIGDSSGRTHDRPALSKERIESNMASYAQQIAPFLDLQKANIKYNSSWLDTKDFLQQAQITGSVTFSSLLQRDDFRGRLNAGSPLTMAEFMYPVLMGLDSVHLCTDLEVGGDDQLLNLQICRDVQTNAGQEPEVIITVPILLGTNDTEEKMSKSKSNYIALSASPENMYRQIVSMPDSIGKNQYGRLEIFFKTLTEMTDSEWASIANQLESGQLDPRDVKKMLAHLITQIVHGKENADLVVSTFS